MPQLIRASSTPLYHQLAQTLRAQLRSGAIPAGEKIPTERELMELYHVSRNTVRLAVDALEREGLVERLHGSGTYAVEPKLQLGIMRLTSFTEDMLERGLSPASRLIQAEVQTPPPTIAEKLHLLPGEKALLVTRLRYADGEPMSMNTSYFTIAHCPGLPNEDFENQSIYTLLEKKFGMTISRAEQSIRARGATAQESTLLNVKPGVPLLVVEGTVFAEDDSPIEFLRSIYRSDRYEFRVNPIRVP
ncbi:MAG TPA: GntR family transcriptional regulator [Anaerolineaceae bacterium]|nr:GntR family transcriptional regulator [Anaerolineaceae bacterium]